MTRAKSAPKSVRPPVFTTTNPKHGTVAQQTELDTALQGMNPEQLQGAKMLIHTMTHGACINGDGTIDPDTGLKTTGGYRKSVHYLKAWFDAHPQPVQLA